MEKHAENQTLNMAQVEEHRKRQTLLVANHLGSLEGMPDHIAIIADSVRSVGDDVDSIAGDFAKLEAMVFIDLKAMRLICL